METKKNAKQKMDMLTAVEEIVEFSKTSQFDAAFFKKLSKPLKYLSSQLDITKEQSFMMALFMDNSSDASICISDFAKQLKCSTILIIRFMKDIDVLESKGLICGKRSNMGLSYRVPWDVIEAFKNNEKYMPKDYSNLSCDELFNRLMHHLQNDTFAIITAYRYKDSDGNLIPKKENIKRNRELRAKLNSEHMGVYQLVGHWQEAPEGMDYGEAKDKNLLTDVIERSYVVPKRKDLSDEDFIDFIKSCMVIDGQTQDACIIHTDKFYILFNNGEMEPIGTKVSLNKIGQAFSESVLKNGYPFVFNCVDAPTSVAGFMFFERNNLLYLR